MSDEEITKEELVPILERAGMLTAAERIGAGEDRREALMPYRGTPARYDDGEARWLADYVERVTAP